MPPARLPPPPSPFRLPPSPFHELLLAVTARRGIFWRINVFAPAGGKLASFAGLAIMTG